MTRFKTVRKRGRGKEGVPGSCRRMRGVLSYSFLVESKTAVLGTEVMAMHLTHPALRQAAPLFFLRRVSYAAL